ncbi:MAG: sugar phosphate isomerase/epimerase [Bacilli bacterium]|nr:sugar phosphate isomerase/epimerase [Bacilli bacterium]
MIRLCAFADEASPSLEGQIANLKKHNIHLLEIRNIDGKNVLDFTDSEAKTIYEKLLQNNIKVWSIGSPLGKVDIAIDFREYEKKVIRVCELANIFHCDNIRMFSFFNAYGEKEKVISNLQKMVAIAKKYNVKMCHENEKGIYGDIASRCVEILNAVPGLYYVYDPANFLQCKQAPVESLALLLSRAYYLHIKDALIATGEVVPAGEGDGHLQEIINSVDDNKVLTIEPHLKVFAGYGNIDKTQLKIKFEHQNNEEAFAVAVNHAKQLLFNARYRETADGFIKQK